MRSVCVFCGSNTGAGEDYVGAARSLARAIARRRLELVYGGGSIGLMGQLADAALEAGAHVIGVTPRHLVEREVAHAGLTELRIVETMHERKALMADLSDEYPLVLLPQVDGRSGRLSLPGKLGSLKRLRRSRLFPMRMSWLRTPPSPRKSSPRI